MTRAGWLAIAALTALAGRGRAMLMALREPAIAARHCSRAVLLYDADRVAQGPSNIMLTQENLESLYQCRPELAGCPIIPLVR